MNVVKELQRINQKELEKGYDAKASWCVRGGGEGGRESAREKERESERARARARARARCPRLPVRASICICIYTRTYAYTNSVRASALARIFRKERVYAKRG